MKKFSDEELSSLLSAHEAGILSTDVDRTRKGDESACCLLQAVYGYRVDREECDPDFVGWDWDLWPRDKQHCYPWFDTTYKASWTVDEFLRALEAQGLA